ncbi:hypothetical protein FRC09_009392 [Ceratobasidium sp. 395]|nr:hypothetical protein FRC09_009392 [Ceratobasidium sp. 395]
MAARRSLWPRSQRKERSAFIGNSLTSSRLVSERILAWSGSSDRGRLFAMRFHSQWGHEICPVMGWYNQQRRSSTTFQSIEHCRTLEGPFYHEFLLLKLTDGAVCRVERTGEGSRAGAIRYTLGDSEVLKSRMKPARDSGYYISKKSWVSGTLQMIFWDEITFSSDPKAFTLTDFHTIPPIRKLNNLYELC